MYVDGTLPLESLESPTSVPFNGSFILTGGRDNLNPLSKKILLYEPLTENWTELPGKLTIGRKFHAAMFVKKNMFPKCN